MKLSELFQAVQGGEALVRLARQEIYRQQQLCPHPHFAAILQNDPDEPDRERCTLCRHERLKP